MRKQNLFNYLYPILLALYPVLALRGSNLVYVNMAVTIRSLIFTFLAAGIIWLILGWVLKNWHKAGILTSLGFLLFYSYGHVFLWAKEASFGPVRHRTLIALFVLLLAVLSFLVLRLRDARGLARFLNTTSIVLTGFILVQFSVYAFQVNQASKEVSASQDTVAARSGETLPDIYLIILDAHTRSDVLLDHYDYDNSEFIGSLENLGFYVADCSQSNYPGTNFSLISLMNMNYFYNLFDEVQVFPALKHSGVSKTLRGLGYTVVAFENRASGHFDLLEDIHLSRNNKIGKQIELGGGMNEFEAMLIDTSLMRIFMDMPQILPAALAENVKGGEYYEHYMQTLYILEELKNVPALPGPKFVLAHIMAPHDPYIFTPEGEFEFSGNRGPIVGYRNNVQFIDNFLPETIEAIIQNSSTPPIIIIQGDHGPTGIKNNPEYRMKILNAYLVDDGTRQNLYPTITPVNSFRVIFNAYFDTQYPLLEDHSYNVWKNAQMLDQDPEIANLCQP